MPKAWPTPASATCRDSGAKQARSAPRAASAGGAHYLPATPCQRFLAIAEEMLEGEIAYRRGDHDAAFAHLRTAIALEDDLP